MSKSLHCRRNPPFKIYSCIGLSHLLGKSHSLGFYYLIFSCFLTCVLYLSAGKERRSSASTRAFSLGGLCGENGHCKTSRVQSMFREQSEDRGHDVAARSCFPPSLSPCLPRQKEQTETSVFV